MYNERYGDHTVKKIYIAVVWLLVAASALSLTSCISLSRPPKAAQTDGESTAPADTEKATPAAPDYCIVDNDFIRNKDKYLNIIGSADYSGASFVIATPRATKIDPDGITDAMSKCSYERNREIEERYNVKISTKVVDPEGLYEAVKTACLKNEFFADALMIPQYYLHAYITSGILLNMNSLPFSDFESGFNMESGIGAGAALSEVWGMGGWSTLDFGSLPAVFFNKELIASCGLEDPYTLVKSGEWTWDRFFEYCGKLPGLDSASYTYGTQNLATYFADSVYFSEGNRFVKSGIGDYPTIAMDEFSSSHTMAVEQTLFNDPYKIKSSPEAIGVFAKGSSMFLIDRLDTMKSISNSGAVWGVLPMPKKDAAQEKYISLVPPEALMYAVPANSTGAEKVSRIISALNACSLGYSADAYVTDCLSFWLRDNDSSHSVEKICYGATWDMAYSVAGYNDAVPNCTFFAVRKVSENDRDIRYYLDMFANGANAAMTRLFS